MTPPVFRVKQNAEFELDHGQLPCYDDGLCSYLTACDIDLSKRVFRARIYEVEGQCAFLALSIHHVRLWHLNDMPLLPSQLSEPTSALCLRVCLLAGDRLFLMGHRNKLCTRLCLGSWQNNGMVE
jgi:hypothetical protein